MINVLLMKTFSNAAGIFPEPFAPYVPRAITATKSIPANSAMFIG
jgi:hypothetical protein